MAHDISVLADLGTQGKQAAIPYELASMSLDKRTIQCMNSEYAVPLLGMVVEQ